MTAFTRLVEVRAAFDKRHPDPKKNYGIHGAELAFYLSGPNGTIQFVIYTHWHLPHVQAETDSKPNDPRVPYMFHKPSPADIGYHSKVPRYEGQTPIAESGQCKFIPDGPCYYDGSGLNAERVFDIMVEGGTDALWAEMERRYHVWLPDATQSTEQHDEQTV